jgi:hypothetical protein
MRSDDFDDHNDDIWDEHRWEQHINDAEQKSEELRQYLESTLGKEPPRWFRLLEDHDKTDVVDQFIEEELMFEEAYFPDDDDDWEEDEEEDDIFMSDEADDADDDSEDDFPDEMEDLNGEEWKAVSAEFTLSDYGDIQKWPIYTNAHDLTLDVFQYAKSNPSANEDHQFVEMGSLLLQMSAKLAGGYSFGFDVDSIGGNIVYCRKSLQFANRALELLQDQNKKRHMVNFPYADIHGRLFELRNDIGVFVQELRDRFKSGL